MEKSEHTRQTILNAALDLFRDKGFEESTMREVAARAGVAQGLAYYYFRRKEDLVLAYYLQAADEMRPRLEEASTRTRKLEERIRALIEVKLEVFGPNRRFLGALLGYAGDPASPLSPFSAHSAGIREIDTSYFARALEECRVNVPDDLAPLMPRLLWLYQLGVVFFWLFDRSPEQRRTQALLAQSARMVVALTKLAGLPLTRPARRMVIELAAIVEGRDD